MKVWCSGVARIACSVLLSNTLLHNGHAACIKSHRGSTRATGGGHRLLLCGIHAALSLLSGAAACNGGAWYAHAQFRRTISMTGTASCMHYPCTHAPPCRAIACAAGVPGPLGNSAGEASSSAPPPEPVNLKELSRNIRRNARLQVCCWGQMQDRRERLGDNRAGAPDVQAWACCAPTT